VDIRIATVLVALVAIGQQPAGQAPAQPQRPVFRGGTAVVRVDAYPTRQGKIIEGLTADDFEIYEDGKLQPLASVEYVPFDDLPDDDRGTFLSPREGLDLAGDSRYRVIIFVIDRQAFAREDWPAMRESLMRFLQTEITPRDLLALITTDRGWGDLVIGRRLSEIQREIDSPEWIHPVLSEQTMVLNGCGLEGLQSRIHADESYALLEGLVQLLGQVREDRTAVIYLSNGLTRQGPDRRAAEQRTLSLPTPIGLVNGKIQRVPRATAMHDEHCRTERRRLAETDFGRRFEELIMQARASNVAFYPIAVPLRVPLLPPMAGTGRGVSSAIVPTRLVTGFPTSLGDLAAATDGLMISGTGDVLGGLRRVVQDATSHYLLGYYSTNTKADGKIRSIKVRLKGGDTVRARPFYRAPGKQDMKALAESPAKSLAGPPQHVANALDVLSRARPSAQFFAYPAVAGSSLTVVVEVPYAAVQAGRWSDGAALEVIAEAANGETTGMGRGRLLPNGRAVLQVPLEGTSTARVLVRLRADGESIVERTTLNGEASRLVGDPLAYRSGPRGLAVPVGQFEFYRDEKMRLDWPLLGKVDAIEARLLDKKGQPLKHKVSPVIQDSGEGRRAVAEVSLTSFARGDYVVELIAKSGATMETKVTAFRMK
jgi:VWFA-related protein